MMEGIIIDDEINSVELLQHLVKTNCPDIEIIAAETSPERAIERIEKLRPDVVFLDVEMPEMSGFELLEKLKHLSFHVIFITAYDNYAVKAFRYNTIDYLLKPVIVSELKSAVKKLTSSTQHGTADTDIHKLLETIRKTQNQNKLAVNSQNEIIYIETEKIICLKADSNYTDIILTNNSKIVSSKTLKDYEEALNATNFFRTQKAFIINLEHVEKFIKSDGGYVVMKNNLQIPVSREKRPELLKLLALR